MWTEPVADKSMLMDIESLCLKSNDDANEFQVDSIKSMEQVNKFTELRTSDQMQ